MKYKKPKAVFSAFGFFIAKIKLSLVNDSAIDNGHLGIELLIKYCKVSIAAFAQRTDLISHTHSSCRVQGSCVYDFPNWFVCMVLDIVDCLVQGQDTSCLTELWQEVS